MTFRDEVSIVLAGEAGQGLQSIETMVAAIAKKAGFHVFATKEYMSRVRGGSNSTELRISSRPVSAYVDRMDILLPLTKAGLDHVRERIGPATLVIGEAAILEEPGIVDLPFSSLASGIGASLYANTIAVGLLTSTLGIAPAEGEALIAAFFGKKGEPVVQKNLQAFRLGHAKGLDLASQLTLALVPDPGVQDRIMVNGAEAISLGALAGGCNYVCAYPMSPGTSVLTTMAEYSKSFDLVVEQVEDEIGVANMALGAWYAGARALVTTSGGGFALMGEAVSLSGSIETPLVIHLAQRPGPATGLPTRTEQADLDLAIHAGHGDFLRIVLAPGDLAEGFSLGRRAFELADRWQSPVVLLSDQYFVDSYYTTPAFDPGQGPSDQELVLPAKDYQRYRLGSPDGLSPRALPGKGQGLVSVDSDEHDESGHITEEKTLRKAMVEKRLAKLRAVQKDIIGPSFYGQRGSPTLIVSWGSTKAILLEALESLRKQGVEGLALLHYSWVFPLPEDTRERISGYGRVIVVEGNATGQFASLLEASTGLRLEDRILKYDGYQFSVEELVDRIGGIHGR